MNRESGIGDERLTVRLRFGPIAFGSGPQVLGFRVVRYRV